MVRIHCMRQWFDLSDQGMRGMEEAFFDTLIYREFAGLSTPMAECLTSAPS